MARLIVKRLIFILIFLSFGVVVSAQRFTIHNPYSGVSFSNYRKSALHFHTIESDGEQTVEERIEGNNPPGRPKGLADYGFDLIAIADHDSYRPIPTPERADSLPTWPWHWYDGMSGYVPTATYIWQTDTSSIYYGNNHDGIYAIRANEFTACQEEDAQNQYTHINQYFTSLGYDNCPSNGFDGYLQAVADSGGMALINHPGRHTAGAAFYNDLYTRYGTDVLFGIEIHNAGDYRPVQNPRVLWDSINAMRPADSLVWGLSNSDIHQSAYDDTLDYEKNFNIHFLGVNDTTETDIRNNFKNGAFTASWSGLFNDWSDPNHVAGTCPTLTGVTITNNTITLTATNCDSIRWFDNTHDSILTGTSIDISTYAPNSNFVRAELYYDDGVNEPGITYTQPFGIVDNKTYYVRADGSDSNTGADTTATGAWASLQKAFETAEAGDTVWVMDRGGIYQPAAYETGHDIFNIDATSGTGNSGTASARIVYINYPGENPKIDLGENFSPASSNVGFYFDSIHYIDIIGLEVYNMPKADSGPNAMVFDFHSCSNLRFENNNVHHNGGAAFRYFSGIGSELGILTDSTYIINNDFFFNVDSAKNHADGVKYDQDLGAYAYFYGNRAAFNSDDGLDCSGSGVYVFDRNICFGNGHYAGGNGNGIKTGAVRDTVSDETVLRVITRNLLAENHDVNYGGFGLDIVDNLRETGDTIYYRAHARIIGNTSIHNDINFEANSNDEHYNRLDQYRNNIAFNPRFFQDVWVNVQIGMPSYVESHNTWDRTDGGYGFIESTDTVGTVSASYFVTVDSTAGATQVQAARLSNGEIDWDNWTYGKLASSSPLIDKGTIMGWSEITSIPGVPTQTFLGAAPDIGFMESFYMDSQVLKSDGKFVISTRGNLLRKKE